MKKHPPLVILGYFRLSLCGETGHYRIFGSVGQTYNTPTSTPSLFGDSQAAAGAVLAYHL
jgi:hypothetical protein